MMTVQPIDPHRVDFDLPGKHHYRLAFHLDSRWGYSLVPMTVINGPPAQDAGTGIAIIGGTHGNEYEGQIAVKRLCRDLDPNEVRGRVILMPQLSEAACTAHTRDCPEDGVNMNRAFPGDAHGSLSLRIAHFVKARVFPHVRVVIDIHAGGREAIFPLCTSLHPISDPARREEAMQIARLFDTPFIYVYSRQMTLGLLTDEAEADGKLALGSELGFAEGATPRGVRHAYEGVRNVLRHYQMLPGPVRRIDEDRASPPRVVQALDLADYVPCPRNGIWEPVVEPGADVSRGALLGRLHDFADHASDPLEIRAHRDGVVIALHFSAACRQGSTLYVLAEDISAQP
ncbi:MAG: succinylglutamate desuccinylase [Vicinamibacteraceae bacterium]